MRQHLASCRCLGQDGLILLILFFYQTWPVGVSPSGLELQLIGPSCFSYNRIHQTNPNIANINLVASQVEGIVSGHQALHYKGPEFELEQPCGDLALPKRSILHLKQNQRQDVQQPICTALRKKIH
jgi:hypothetical protein